jgi:hypothetical protein
MLVMRLVRYVLYKGSYLYGLGVALLKNLLDDIIVDRGTKLVLKSGL